MIVEGFKVVCGAGFVFIRLEGDDGLFDLELQDSDGVPVLEGWLFGVDGAGFEVYFDSFDDFADLDDLFEGLEEGGVCGLVEGAVLGA